MNIETLFPSGAIQISAFVGKGADEYLLTRTYYDYTIEEAIALFKKEKEENNVKG